MQPGEVQCHRYINGPVDEVIEPSIYPADAPRAEVAPRSHIHERVRAPHLWLGQPGVDGTPPRNACLRPLL